MAGLMVELKTLGPQNTVIAVLLDVHSTLYIPKSSTTAPLQLEKAELLDLLRVHHVSNGVKLPLSLSWKKIKEGG